MTMELLSLLWLSFISYLQVLFLISIRFSLFFCFVSFTCFLVLYFRLLVINDALFLVLFVFFFQPEVCLPCPCLPGVPTCSLPLSYAACLGRSESACNSSSVSSTDTEAMFSSRCATLDVPGIGRIAEDRFKSHASASCATGAPGCRERKRVG